MPIFTPGVLPAYMGCPYIPTSRYAKTGRASSVNWPVVPAGGMKYFDCDGRSGRSGNRTEQPGTSSSTALVPRPAVITTASDSTGPPSVATLQPRPARLRPRTTLCSATCTPRAGSAAVSILVTAARSAKPASTSSHPPSTSNWGNLSRSRGAEDGKAQRPVAARHIRRHAALDQIQAAAVHQQRLAPVLLEFQPEPPRFVG